MPQCFAFQFQFQNFSKLSIEPSERHIKSAQDTGNGPVGSVVTFYIKITASSVNTLKT